MSSSSTSSNSTTKTKEINVIVVGVSGSEAVKGPSGVGKSLLCNRFVRPAADEFHREHSSVLSQIDFCGSPVINKDHWLYWGSRVLSSSEASTSNVLVRVAEQTEFLDDETFETIAGCSKSESYSQRCSRTSLQSRDKLMYIQKEQLGLESEFPQHLLPDGKFNVDGFILACDVSKETVLHSNHVINIAKSIAKTKKPIVIAFTKCDEMSEECKRHYMTLFLATKELKHVLCNLPPVETSAVKNVNVEYLFGSLAMLCLRSQKLAKKPPLAYHEASLFVEQRNLHVKCCFSTLLSQAVPLCVYPKKCLSWKQVLADIDRHPDLMNFVEVFGSRVAFEMYERYVSEAKELWAMNRLRSLAPRLFEIFQVFLDVVDLAEMEWNMARDYMRCYPLFSVLFENNDYDLDMWSPSTFNVDEKSRLPAEILLLPEAANVFEQFRHSTQSLRLKHQLAQEFEYLLHEIQQILPGSSLDSSYPSFQHFSIIKKLSPEIIAEVYDIFQQKLIENARRQMEECLLEAATEFQNNFHGTSEFLGIKQLDTVRNYVEKDRRYQWMKLIPAERDQIILTHLPFIFNASPLNCPSLEMCIDMVGASILNDFSEQTSTFGGSSGFSECFEATRRNSGKKMARIQICAMCGDRLCIDSLATALFHNDLIRSPNLNYSTDGSSFIEVLDESTQNWNTLELSMNSYHSWTHRNDTNPQQFIDFTDGYLFVYNSKRASSFHYARCAIEKLGETNLVNFDCILLVAVVEGVGGGSDSMKIDLEYLTEGADLCKSIGARFSVLDFRKRKTKSNVLNIQLMEFLHDVCDGQVQPIENSEISSLENDRPSVLAPSFPSSGIQLLTKPDTSTRSRRPKPINSRNRVTRTDPLIMSHFYTSPIEIQPAPLATPEAVDFSPAYSMVNDAVHTIIQVTGASPKTPPIFKSYENSLPETRSTTSTFSGSSPAPRAVSAEITRRPRTSSVSLSTDSINRLHRTSNLFQLHPETAMTTEQKQKSLSIESLTKPVAEKDKNRGFVRKVATSFRLRKSLLDTTSTDENGGGGEKKVENKKKSSVTATSPEQISSFLEKMATRSLPQSPRTDRKAKLYSSLNSTTEKVSNVLSWLPSKSSKRLMKNKSATHDLSTSLTSFTASTSTQGVIASNENLESLCSSSTTGIPDYLEKCIEFIENNGGFEQEGLYRVPGNQTHLAEVEKRFLKTGIFDVSSFDTPVHVAATALKSFFSCLPESLIPTDYHSKWKQIMMNSEEDQKIEGIRHALSQLPPSNQTVLRYLVKHLAKVSCSPKTVMNSNNLSKIDLERLTESAELYKSIGARFSVLDFRKRKTKSNVLNIQLMEFLNDVCDGQMQPIGNSELSSLENDLPSILAPSFPTSGIQLLAKHDTLTRSRRPKPINSRNRVTRTDPLIMSHFYTFPIEIQPAPLATPEAVDFSPAYSMVNIGLEYLTEGAELCKSIGARFSVLDLRILHQWTCTETKSNVLNIQLMEFLHDVCDGQVQPIGNSEISSLENDRPSILAPSFPSSGIQLLTKPNLSTRNRRPKPSNSRNRVTGTDPLIMSHFYTSPIEIQPAPLATPEAVDFSPAYSVVNDAVHTIIQVTGASPKTPPIFKSYENSSPETRSTTSTFSGSSPAPRAVSAEITRRPRTSSVSLSTDSINRLHRTSNLFQLHPETALTAEQKQKSLSIESLTKSVAEKDKNRGFVRKVATSFRLRKSLLDTTSTDENGGGGEKKVENKKKSSVTATSPEQISSFLEKMATRSLPQSPRTDRKAKLYSSLNSTTEKVSNVVSWLPSKSSKRLMKNKSATHDLSTSLTSFTASTSTQGVIASNENLESLCSSSTTGIPVYLEKCIEFIENNGGFEQEGLYRVPGNQTHLAEVEKRFLKSGIFDVSSFDTPVHVAATALKSFFSCLPESLIPTDYHSRWKQIMMNSEEDQKIEGIRHALSQLPPSNQTILRYLVKHLAKVSCSPKTVMNSNNLSKVWTPTLFRPVFTSYEELSSGIIAFQLALELIIIHSESLFC